MADDEVRLHGHYPRLPYRVEQRVALELVSEDR